MRKSYQTKEYKEKAIFGTASSKEQKNVFCSKMMDIQDTILVDSNYDNLKKLHISAPQYSIFQTDYEKNDLTKWDFNISTKQLLSDVLYNKIYTQLTYSEFNKINEQNLSTQRISDFVLSYINTNLLNLYKLDTVYLWVKYFDLAQSQINLNGENITILKQSPQFTLNVKGDYSKVEKINYTNDLFTYKQISTSRYFTFCYYYDILFKRI